MKLGDIVEKVIHVITFGQGYRIALFIAKKMGYDDCGCKARQQKLNQIFPYKATKVESPFPRKSK